MFFNDNIFEQIYFGNTLKQYIWFLGILLFGFLLLRFFSRFSSRMMFRLIKRYSAEVKIEKFVELLVKPVELFLIATIIFSAIQQLQYPLHEIIFQRKKFDVTIFEVVDKLYVFFLVLSVFWMLLRLVDFIALVFEYKASLTETKSDDQLVLFVRELVKIVLGIIGLFVMLGAVLEINVLTLITGLGIGGIAVALAAKDSLENLFGSFTIFIDKPFVVGDAVKVDGIEGTIEKVGFRSTQIRSIDRSIITVPNKKMIDNALENLTLRNFRRVKFSIGLTYDTDAASMKKITEDISNLIKKHSKMNEEGVVVFEEFGDSALKLMVLYFIEMTEYYNFLKIKEEINYEIIDIIEKHGSSFAFPTRTIIHQEESNNIVD